MCGANGVSAALNGRMISIEPIQRLANADIRSRALPDIVSGRKGSSLGITEPSGGSDVAGMKTTARFDSGTYVINGSKAFITGGMTSDFFVIGARTGGDGLAGISLFLWMWSHPDSRAHPWTEKWAGGAQIKQHSILKTCACRQKT